MPSGAGRRSTSPARGAAGAPSGDGGDSSLRRSTDTTTIPMAAPATVSPATAMRDHGRSDHQGIRPNLFRWGTCSYPIEVRIRSANGAGDGTACGGGPGRFTFSAVGRWRERRGSDHDRRAAERQCQHFVRSTCTPPHQGGDLTTGDRHRGRRACARRADPFRRCSSREPPLPTVRCARCAARTNTRASGLESRRTRRRRGDAALLGQPGCRQEARNALGRVHSHRAEPAGNHPVPPSSRASATAPRAVRPRA